ncbi:MAG: hypothetical protein OXH84_02420 [Gammaproteobacteria bacterium]|nr:hypothetical protein [Gammaproteobacteria bacterium]
MTRKKVKRRGMEIHSNTIFAFLATVPRRLRNFGASTQEENINADLAEEEIYDKPIKTQIDQRWFITKVPESEKELEELIEKLHEKASIWSGFKHHNPATNIYIYVYHDKETAENEETGADWLGMSAESFNDETNAISLNSSRLKKLQQPSEVHNGLEESKRKEIFEELKKSEQRTMKESQSTRANGIVDLDYDKYLDLRDEYRAEQLLKKHSITEEQLSKIAVEGVSEGFR